MQNDLANNCTYTMGYLPTTTKQQAWHVTHLEDPKVIFGSTHCNKMLLGKFYTKHVLNNILLQ